jgi:hypothetical protein
MTSKSGIGFAIGQLSIIAHRQYRQLEAAYSSGIVKQCPAADVARVRVCACVCVCAWLRAEHIGHTTKVIFCTCVYSSAYYGVIVLFETAAIIIGVNCGCYCYVL